MKNGFKINDGDRWGIGDMCLEQSGFSHRPNLACKGAEKVQRDIEANKLSN
jgi:hypothetical protein